MQFKVPQFIDIEDKIIGPLTLKQFLYLLAGAGILAIAWFFLELVVFIIIGIPIIGLALAIAFYRINGQPLVYLLGSIVKYLTKPRLYLWQRK